MYRSQSAVSLKQDTLKIAYRLPRVHAFNADAGDSAVCSAKPEGSIYLELVK